jgi:hypothetical protein
MIMTYAVEHLSPEPSVLYSVSYLIDFNRSHVRLGKIS